MRPELLRHHPADDDRHYRESLYFNLGDPDSGVGVWIYFWTYANQNVTRALIALYKGIWPKPILTRQARQGKATITGSVGDDRWLFVAHAAGDQSYGEDFDAVSFGGLEIALTATGGGHRHSVRYTDGEGALIDLDFAARDPLWLYGDAAHGCPPWLGTDRYHQAVLGTGTVTIGGRTVAIDGVGDSDHSWGSRDYKRMAAADFDYWAWCSPDAADQLSLFRLREPDLTQYLGHLTVGGETSEVADVGDGMAYDDHGVPLGGRLVVTDRLGRTVEARAAAPYSAVGYGDPERSWSGGYESVTRYELAPGRTVAGLYSYSRLGA
ncbi:hypothetical protein [Acrocarpospora catenulata]|uniref:hypothetical protein n=1 Tax=Acrocarpospora catenulata TaxID=2836182 RepID=UPI001BDA8CDB|nr:hypothetical protein [Acrocarpospora catenulata]